MKIIFAGTPEFAAVALDALLKTENEIVGGEPDEGESTEKRKEKAYER